MIIGHEAKDYELMGYPSEELDTAWADLMQDFYTEVPYSYVENVRRLDEGIPSEGGGFLAIYSFMHQLHCLVRLKESCPKHCSNEIETDPSFVLARAILPQHDRKGPSEPSGA